MKNKIATVYPCENWFIIKQQNLRAISRDRFSANWNEFIIE